MSEIFEGFSGQEQQAIRSFLGDALCGLETDLAMRQLAFMAGEDWRPVENQE